ncbi:MAG: DUF488 domain-containing protein [Gemmatimonadota bacterium]|nr:MAG: DUF488 domain-containing protein [Gemmatimonadota bacterium]
MNEKSIYTLGTSDRSIKEFLDVLREYEIQRVIDVRRFPTSKFAHFKKENLLSMLESKGFLYSYSGDTLGGYRAGGYKSYMETDPFQKALDRVERMAETESSVIVCAERLPWRCHRRFIADRLRARGRSVIHIIEANKTWEPEEQLDFLKD